MFFDCQKNTKIQIHEYLCHILFGIFCALSIGRWETRNDSFGGITEVEFN
jgi:hypothetical protein